MIQRLDFTDDAPILQAAFDKLPYPRPVRVAKVGMQGVATAAWALLQAAQPVGPYRRSDFEKAVATVIKMLITEGQASASRASSSPSTPELGRVEHEVAMGILQRNGRYYDHDEGEYLTALSEATEQLGMRAVQSFELPEMPSDMRMTLAQEASAYLGPHRERCQLESRARYGRDLEQLTEDERLDVFERVGNWS